MSWKTAKPPWTLGGKYNKTSYNEGDKITTKANPVFVPATENAPGGTSVTVKHAPCGYWFSTPNVSFNSLNILGVEVAFCSNGSIVIGPGCEDGTCAIAYTTQGMSVNEEQTLSVTTPADNCIYSWAITSGGGSLSAASGNSVVYTAPSTNANCANNATITLTTLGSVCDSLGIAVNANTGVDDRAYRVVTQLVHPGADEGGLCAFTISANPNPNTGLCDGYIIDVFAKVKVSYYLCNGNEWVQSPYPCEATQSSGFSGLQDGDGKFYLCDNAAGRAEAVRIVMYDGSSAACGLSTQPWGDAIDESPVDLRYARMITAGCCPGALV